MKISVIITLKKDVLDPQGKVIHQTLDGMGFNDVNEVRQGKYFEIDTKETDEENIFHTRLRDMHDLWHVTTGYGRDALGELSLLAFTYAQERNRGIGAIVLYGYRIMGKVTRELNFNIDLRDVVKEGYKLGKEASFWACADWEKLSSSGINL